MVSVKALLCVALCSLTAAHSWARADDAFQAGLEAEARGDSQAALQCFLTADRAKPNNPKIQQRLARQYSDLVDVQSDLAHQKHYAQCALEYSQRADKLEPQNAEHVLSLAICYGKLARLPDCGTRTKIEYSRMVKQEAEEAAILDPHYAWAHYLLGRWNYEVAKLGQPAKLMAHLLYGGLGEASNQTAIQELNRATELQPKEPAMWVDLGFAYEEAGQMQNARRAWKKGIESPGTALMQVEAKERARAALARN
jgi:tetratricopeptide (TPR) repeat protein